MGGGGPAASLNPGALKFSVHLTILPVALAQTWHGCGGSGLDGAPPLSWPGLPSPKPYPRKSPALPTPEPLGLTGHRPPQPYTCTFPLSPYLGAQRQGLLSIAAPSVHYCLRRPLLVLREVPFTDMSLLGGVGLSPNSVKPFWDQGLALLGTRRCVDPLPARPALSQVWGQALPVGMTAPTPYRIECCRLVRLYTPCAIFLLTRVVGFQPWGSSPALCLLALVETEEPRVQASWWGCCGHPLVPVSHFWLCPSLCSCSCMWMLHVWSGAWMLHCPKN